jgi:hypothetical protein
MKNIFESFPWMIPGSTMFPSFHKQLGFAVLSFVQFDRMTTVLNSSIKEEVGGVSIINRIRDLKRRRVFQRREQPSSFYDSHGSLLEAKDALFSDRSDVDLLAEFYKDKGEQERHVSSDAELSASFAAALDISDTEQSASSAGGSAVSDAEQSASSTAESAVSDTDVYDVIIIGAGWAGIAAAMTLKAKGITNFIVLEAKDHIGGRSHTINESFHGQNIPIDLGSMWIHGGRSNPLYPILTTVGGIRTSESTFPERMYKSNGGGAYTDHELNTYYKKLYENGFMAYQGIRQESTDVDESLQTAANKYLSKISSAEEKSIAKYFMRNNIEIEYSGPMNDVSFSLKCAVCNDITYPHLSIILT